MPNDTLPVAILGAGPVGLAAAAHLIGRGITPAIFERGESAGAAVAAWGHVRVFTPWRYIVDSAARELLDTVDWTPPDPDDLPLGREIVARYLAPLAAHPRVADVLRTGATVTSVTRAGLSKIDSGGREAAPFAVHWQDETGAPHQTLARAVIDASGTWYQPGPIGIDGHPVPGEAEARDRIAYGIPDVLGADEASYAGARVLLIGAGHSAANVLLELERLRREAPGTRIYWARRRASLARLVGGGATDELAARGQLGLAAEQLVASGKVETLAPFAVQRIERAGAALSVTAIKDARPVTLEVDRIVVATGFRPNLDLLRELRIESDPVMEAPPRLAPLIDPNLHSCGTVPPHGVTELSQPETDAFVVGMKSYGRAPTFLMLTGYEQVRSIAAHLAGDEAAAREVHLSLPETGICGGPAEATTSSCCGGPRSSTAAPACC